MGLPVVASRLPVIERYFGDDVLFAEPGDPASIAAAIEGIRRAPETALARARLASQRLAEIEWRRQRKRYLEDSSTAWSSARGAVEVERLLLITPARDEAAHLERTAWRPSRPRPARPTSG